MSAPALYRDTADGQIKRFATAREVELEIQDIQALADGTLVNLFTTATAAVNVATSVAADNDITIGPVGNRIVIDNTTGSEVIKLDGDVEITGTETVTDTATFNGNVTIGDAAGDVLDVNATSNFDANVTFSDGITVNFGTAGNVTVDTTHARFNDDLTFDGAAARAITNDSNNLTVSTTTSGNLNLTGADDVNVTIGASAGDVFSVNTDLLLVDGNTGRTLINTAAALPAGNTAQLTVNHDTANKPVITLKSGAVSATSLLTGTGDPDGSVSAPRGSLYLDNLGTLHVKTTSLPDTTWAAIGTTAGSTLQAAYDSSGAPATITMAVSKNLVFQTNEAAGTESDFLVEQSGGADYLLCDASADHIDLGSAGIGVRMLNDIEMAGVAPFIIADGTDLTISTINSGDVVLMAAGSVGIGTAAPSASDELTVSGANPRSIQVTNTTDSVSAQWGVGAGVPAHAAGGGSLYSRQPLAGASSLYVNTSVGAGATWTELATAGSTTLQAAYDNGNTIGLTDNRHMTITLKESALVAHFSVTGASGDYIKADAGNNEVFLGSAGVAVTSNGPVTSITSAFTSIGDATGDALTINCGATTVSTSLGAASIKGDGTNGLTLGNTGAAGTLIVETDNSAAMTIRTVNGNLNVKPTGTGHVFVQNASSEGIEIADTGAITILGGGETLNIADGSGIAGMTMNGSGDVQINNAGVADQEIGIQAGGDVDIDAGLNSAVNGGDITIDAVKGSGGGGIISLDAEGASNFTVDAAALTLSTTTSGDVIVTAAGDVDITGAGEITITTDTAGDNETMSLLTGSDDPTSVAKSANRGSLYLRDDATDGELYIKQDNGSSTNWDQVATMADAGDVVAVYTTAETCAIGDLMYLVATTGTIGKADADAAAKIRPIGVALDADGVGGASIRVALAGEVTINETAFVAADIGKYIFMDKTTAGGYVLVPPGAAGDTALRVGVLSDADGVANGTMVISFGEPTLI